MLGQLLQVRTTVTEHLNRHLAAVMFTDVAGYTALMQKDEAAALRTRQRHRTALEHSVADRNGEVLQYFGDGSLSIFSSSVEAVEAAVEIQGELKLDPPLRIGLHSGDIAYDVQGAYGDAVNIAARLEAICPPGGVTISQKIYDDIRRHPHLPAVPSGRVRLKHVTEPISLYSMAADGLTLPVSEDGSAQSSDDHDAPHDGTALPARVADRLAEVTRSGLQSVRSGTAVSWRVPLVGRDREAGELRGLLEAAEKGEGVTVFLRGAHGVGKTRLTDEVAQYAGGRDWSVLRGRAHPSERLVPYAPFSDTMLPLLNGLDAESLADLAAGGEASLRSLFPALAHLAAGGELDAPGPGESQSRIYWQFSAILSRLAAHRPLLIVLEDLDFADRASLELFAFLARQARTDAIMFIVEYTGANADVKQALVQLEQSLGSAGNSRVFELAPLDQTSTSEFISRGLSMTDEKSAELSSVVYSWSGGNPFFITGILGGLVERGRLHQEDGHWTTSDLEGIELPRSVSDAVLAWMAQLSPQAFELSRTLSVMGRPQSYELIRHVSGLDDSMLSTALDELVRHQVLFETEADWTVKYEFRHRSMQAALKGELSTSVRRELHGRLGASLEKYFADAADQHADELAYHFGRAHPGLAGASAIRYLLVAGEAALGRQANREAADCLQEALDRTDAAPPGEPQAKVQAAAPLERILAGLARARRRLGDPSASLRHWRRILATADPVTAPDTVASLHRELGLTHMTSGSLEEAIESFAAAVEWASSAANVPLMIRSLLAQGLCHQSIGQAEEAERIIEESLTLAHELGHSGMLAQVHRARVQLKIWTGQIQQARVSAQTALDLARDSGDRGVEFWSQWAMAALEGLIGNTEPMGVRVQAAQDVATETGSPFFNLATQELWVELAYARGEWNEGVDRGHKAIELARRLGDRLVLPRLLVWVSLMHLGRGELDIARTLTDEAWDVSGAGRHTEGRSGFADLHVVVPAHIGRASYELAQGNWPEAIRVAEIGLEIADRSGYIVWSIHHLLPIIAEAAIHSRDLARATAVGDRMKAEAEKVGHPLGLAWAEACRAVVTWLQGDAAAGAESLRRGAEALEAIPLAYEGARLRRQLAGRLAEVGDQERALVELRAAHDVFEALGARPELAKTIQLFAELDAQPPSNQDVPS